MTPARVDLKALDQMRHPEYDSYYTDDEVRQIIAALRIAVEALREVDHWWEHSYSTDLPASVKPALARIGEKVAL